MNSRLKEAIYNIIVRSGVQTMETLDFWYTLARQNNVDINKRSLGMWLSILAREHKLNIEVQRTHDYINYRIQPMEAIQ